MKSLKRSSFLDKYLINEQRLNMFNRILSESEDIELAEEFFIRFFDFVIPKIKKNINQPYELFKDFQISIKAENLRYAIFQEIVFYYLEKDEEPYLSFIDKKNLDTFLEFIHDEYDRLSEKLGIVLDRSQFLSFILKEVKEDLDSITNFSKKRGYLLEKKLEFSTSLHYELVDGINNMLSALSEQIKHDTSYVDFIRIEGLQDSNHSKFDTTKIVQICEELNQAYKEKNYITIPILIRAIIDHVPPIFGKTTFNEVIAHYGTKSFKESMSHLDKSLRKIADALIHNQIRVSEVLPSHTQIDFKADLDVLLSEVCRILK